MSKKMAWGTSAKTAENPFQGSFFIFHFSSVSWILPFSKKKKEKEEKRWLVVGRGRGGINPVQLFMNYGVCVCVFCLFVCVYVCLFVRLFVCFLIDCLLSKATTDHDYRDRTLYKFVMGGDSGTGKTWFVCVCVCV